MAGFGENSRVLAWISAAARAAPTRSRQSSDWCPTLGEGGIDAGGLGLSDEAMAELLEVDVAGWKRQLPQMHEHYAQFATKLQAELHQQLVDLEARLRD